ncbi:Mov34/MPN/PAD-1 family protein [Fodinibius sp. SL11]|uniref:Mov34/MPN/PAD-1 family protein n=1 Tax=Fodinibius sp. SL11 TaxID=3425690 RepID=UPI003F884A5A
MTFKTTNNGKLKISSESIESFSQYRQNEPTKKEAGGLLLGRYIKNSNDIIVDKITIPFERDVRKRYYFCKRDLQHQDIVDQEWESSEGTCNYLGEWHTHPEKNPSPSSFDIKGWREKIVRDSFDHHSLFFIIVGIEEVKAWEALVKNNAIRELQKI